jgi:hypothetical protein
MPTFQQKSNGFWIPATPVDFTSQLDWEVGSGSAELYWRDTRLAQVRSRFPLVLKLKMAVTSIAARRRLAR